MSQVRLKYVESDSFSPGGGITGVRNTSVSAKVQNLGFIKDVAVHYRQDDGSWTERPLNWVKNYGNYDLFSRGDNTIVITEFVLRYTVNGETFWDNNNGSNYHVDELLPNTVGGNVVLNLAKARRGTEAGGGFVFDTSWVEGEIFLNDLSFNKQVGIRLSTNGWASFHDTGATFAGFHSVAEGMSTVQVWKFKTPELNLDNSSPDFKFAVFYHNLDTGQFFWDNNFGQDYTLSKVDLSTDD